ncbi:MAG: hypothetical protein OXE77_01735 [Flavobacteriaceae bacterium]|nr:hypothetical protein [Flavobacteriaceae bacterium]MCY4267871.1 hypothetical protein [Flavobacteriaceae bacterium]
MLWVRATYRHTEKSLIQGEHTIPSLSTTFKPPVFDGMAIDVGTKTSIG